MDTSKEVILELSEMKLLGMCVPMSAVNAARDIKMVQEYRDNGMSISEIASLLIELA